MLKTKDKEGRYNVKTTLKVHRVNRGISIEDAAEALGLSVEQLRKYENYEEYPDWDMIFKMMELYNIESIDEIIFHNKSQEREAFAKKGIKIVYRDELPHIS